MLRQIAKHAQLAGIKQSLEHRFVFRAFKGKHNLPNANLNVIIALQENLQVNSHLTYVLVAQQDVIQELAAPVAVYVVLVAERLVLVLLRTLAWIV